MNRGLSILMYGSASWLGVGPAAACSVCFGDPDSSMAQGAVMGVFVLGGIICCVLAAIAGTALFWVQRARRITRTKADGGPQTERPDRTAGAGRLS